MHEDTKWLLYAVLLLVVAAMTFLGKAYGAGFYLSEVGSPASLGTGGVANPTNTFGADAAWTNPAGMTGLERDQIFAGFQAVIPKVEFDSSTATAGGRDGGNAGNAAAFCRLDHGDRRFGKIASQRAIEVEEIR